MTGCAGNRAKSDPALSEPRNATATGRQRIAIGTIGGEE